MKFQQFFKAVNANFHQLELLNCTGAIIYYNHKELIQNISNNTKLTQLYLGRCDIGCEGLALLFSNIEFMKNIRVLDVSGNIIEFDAAYKLASSCKEYVNLEYLNLSETGLEIMNLDRVFPSLMQVFAF